MAITVTSTSTYRSSDIIHDPIERKGKLSEGEENEFVRRNGELLWTVIVSSAETQYIFEGLDHRNESDYGSEHEKSNVTRACKRFWRRGSPSYEC